MARRFEDPKLVIASHNPGKVREIADLVAPLGAEVVAAGEVAARSHRTSTGMALTTVVIIVFGPPMGRMPGRA